MSIRVVHPSITDHKTSIKISHKGLCSQSEAMGLAWALALAARDAEESVVTVILQRKGTHSERDVSRCREKKRLCKYAPQSCEVQVSRYSSVHCGYYFNKAELTITTGLCSYHQL